MTENDLPDETPQTVDDTTHYAICTYMLQDNKRRLHNDDPGEEGDDSIHDSPPEPGPIHDYSNDYHYNEDSEEDDTTSTDNTTDSDEDKDYIPDLDTDTDDDTTDTNDSDETSDECSGMITDPSEEEMRTNEDEDGNPNIPHPSYCTFNFNGINEGTERCSYMLRNLDKLTETFQIVLAQETKLGNHKNSFLFLQKRYPKWGVYHSAKQAGSAGVLILVSPTLLRDYKVEETVIEQGRALALYLLPKETEGERPSHCPMTIINFYLKSGNCNKDKIDTLIKTRAVVRARGLCLVGGDFNFVLNNKEDSSSNSAYRSTSQELKNEWHRFISFYNLSEIFQRTHTYFQLCEEVELSNSARLDRLFSSHSAAQKEIFRPHGFIPHIPFTRFSKAEGHKVFGSDHCPVGAIFTTTGLARDSGQRILPWVAGHPLFLKIFSDHWSRDVTVIPEDDMWDFKQAAFAASRRTEKLIRGEGRKLVTHLEKLTAAISLLRTCTQHPFILSRFNQKISLYPQIAHLVSFEKDKVKYDRLHDHLEGLIQDNFCAVAENEDLFSTGNNNLPIATNRKNEKGNSIAKELKKALPCNRSRLPGLRERRTGLEGDTEDPADFTELFTDPENMSIIAKRYWKTVWKRATGRRKRAKHAKTYLNEGRVPLAELEIPSVDKIIDLILDTNDSSPGPDGIPFAVYRLLAAQVAPIFKRLVTWFADGNLPSEEFNSALLFLLPKKETFLPEHTRPISVTNSDNRILGKIMVAALAPHLSKYEVLWAAQKGSIAGRQGFDHIRNLNEKFYRAVEDPEGYGDYYVFFMDTRKAFDSIHHEFIFEAMEWIGLPVWAINVVKAMLHKVKVTPFFGKRSGIWIKIRRGVKQGCPLSPWLFAICMQVLIFKLSKIPNIDQLAYVDDLALGSTNYKKFGLCMIVITLFSFVSGLGVNFDKTKGIASCSETNFAKWALTCPWGQFEIASSYVYLGIVFGRWVNSRVIYEAACAKYDDRLRDAIPVIKAMTPARRPLIINIFLTPLFSYIAPHHAIPYLGESSITAVRAITMRAVVSFGGTAYEYSHLIAHTDEFGLAYPLKDLWAYSVVTLAAQFDFAQLDGVTTAPRMEPSNRILKTIEASACDFVNWWLYLYTVKEKAFPLFIADDFSGGNTAKKRKTMYDILISAYHKYHKRDAALAAKLHNRGLPSGPGHVQHIHTVFGHMRKKLPAPARYHQLAMVCNAVATAQRVRFITKRVDVPCRACGHALDHIDHYYDGSCAVAVRGRKEFGSIITYNLSPEHLDTSYLRTSYLMLHRESGTHTTEHAQGEEVVELRFSKKPHFQAITHAIIIYNWAFWLALVKFFPEGGGKEGEVTRKVVSIALSAWSRTRDSSWRQPDPTNIYYHHTNQTTEEVR